jgi:flagellar motor switch protein FliN/FliY
VAESDADPAAAAGDDISADDWAAALAEQETSASPDVQPAAFAQLKNESAGAPPGNLDMILDIPVTITVELGRTKIQIRNLLQLAQGSVIELDGMAGEPMTVLVNGCLIAQGEVVVVNEKFGIRLTDIITPEERLRRLNR